MGTVLTAGDWWFETFAVTWLARVAPELATATPPLPMVVVAFSGFALLAVGTVLLGVASLRARVLPRWVGVLLVVGGAPCLMAGFPPFLLPLGCALTAVGVLVLRATTHLAPGSRELETPPRPQSEHPARRTPPTTQHPPSEGDRPVQPTAS